ncbi:conserved hypothetical protein [Waddlia chondrophila WSU 86-1044]|uniref:PhoD-like phosphatase domain-containing protein n=1 Tax=Waddlia chondrophila (strain ATCC VR-1470 / WSU 86-1044) TaxID=716544 RepID=D6YVG7_WADCW|nr:conserved hypothetical protein [Waddlia chondrophila WSU 86-1044]
MGISSAFSIFPTPMLKCTPLIRFLGQDRNHRAWKVSVLIVSNVKDKNKLICQETSKIQYDFFKIHHLAIEKFQLMIDLQKNKRSISYKIYDRVFSFSVPGEKDPLKMAFFTCNGFHLEEDEEKMGGIMPMWDRYRSQADKADLLVFGGDQEYFDSIFNLPSIKEWLGLPLEERIEHLFTEQMAEEVDHFYLQKYLAKFATDTSFAETLSSTPSVMNWDDHDIFDGWGSYSEKLQSCPVFQGIYAAAEKYYLIFQQHVFPGTSFTDKTFIGTRSFSSLHIVEDIAILSVDTRSKRTQKEILPDEAWEEIFQACKNISTECRHLLVILPIPIIYPDFEPLASFINKVSKIASIAKNILDFFKCSSLKKKIFSPWETLEIQDDLTDYWRNQYHREERRVVIERLQQIATQMNIRVTFLSGDIHLGGMGEIFDPKALSKEKDPLYMAQIISSPMGNAPTGKFSAFFLSYLNNQTEFFNEKAQAKLVSIKRIDQDKEKILLSKRNWAQLTYDPSSHDIKVELCVESKKSWIKVYSTVVPILK